MKNKICTFNVKGLGERKKRNHIFNWLKENEYDICLLQEIHCKIEELSQWEKEWGAKCFLSGNSTNSKGIGIFLKGSFQINDYKEIIEGRLQSLSITINDTDLLLINIYAPNNDDPAFFDTLNEILCNNDDKTFIIGGDFNTVLDTDLDKKNGNQDTHKRSRQKLNTIIENNELSDIWRMKHPNSKQFTWHSNTKPTIFCRLDYFLASTNILNNIIKCNITTGIRSDHSLVNMQVDFANKKRGPGYFKLNNSIILDEKYQTDIRQCILEITANNLNANPNTLWELIKGSIRNTSIQYSSYKKKTEMKTEKTLIEQIDKLEKDYIDQNNDEIELLMNLKKLLTNVHKANILEPNVSL